MAVFVGGGLTANLIVSITAITLGAFAGVSPDRAAEIWGSHRLHKLDLERRPSFVRWYRVFGILLVLGGVLFAVDSILFSRHPQ